MYSSGKLFANFQVFLKDIFTACPLTFLYFLILAFSRTFNFRMGLPFASKEAKELNEAIFETIYHAALEASTELAERYGPYETFEGSPASQGKLQFNLWGLNDEDTFSFRRHAKLTNLEVNHKYGKDYKTGYDWEGLRTRIMTSGLRNSLLVAPMPTASTSQILGVNECFEPFVSNLYLRRVKAGEFIMANPHLLQDLTDRGLWNQDVRNQLMRDSGSVANIECIPNRLKELYKTVWEIKMKDIIDMAADRGKYIDQSQSLNLFIGDPTVDKLTAMHFYAWKKGLKVRTVVDALNNAPSLYCCYILLLFYLTVSFKTVYFDF